MGVVEEVNKKEIGGKKIDTVAISDEEKAKIAAQNTDLMKTPEQAEAEKAKFLPAVDLSGPQDIAVPPKTPQVKSGSVGPSKEVPQQTDKGEDGI